MKWARALIERLANLEERHRRQRGSFDWNNLPFEQLMAVNEVAKRMLAVDDLVERDRLWREFRARRPDIMASIRSARHP
jgi:hypothetical protein